MTFSSASLVTALLLLLSGCAVSVCGQRCNSTGCRKQELSKLFEEALVNSSETLWQLKQIFFSPSDQNPALVTISVEVTVDDIITDQCNSSNDISAFDKCSQYSSDDCNSDQWVFEKEYIRLQPLRSDGSSSILAELIPNSLYSIFLLYYDPTFSSIMRGLSSLTDNKNINLKMHINTTLKENPCLEDASSALGMVLMWVNQNAHHYDYQLTINQLVQSLLVTHTLQTGMKWGHKRMSRKRRGRY